MDDVGWCPLEGCNSLANVEKAENTGRCQHCEFLFCLDCRGSAHPFKRCLINRIDLDPNMKDQIEVINKQNKEFEEKLTEIYIKHCTKPCANLEKCTARITISEQSECSHLQCPKCFTWMCWTCGKSAKGQMHFKDFPTHKPAQDFLPSSVTDEMI